MEFKKVMAHTRSETRGIGIRVPVVKAIEVDRLTDVKMDQSRNAFPDGP